jgi:O-antigen/teichoic acid export membrane protein
MPRGTITWRWRPPMSDLDDSLRRSTLRGGAWMAGATAVVALFQAIKLIVLARYLEPVDFGLMAIVGVIAGFSHTLADGGMSNAIVSRPDLDQRQLSSLYWFNVLAGLAVALTLVVLAQPLALFFGEASLRELIIVSASVFLFKALGNQFRLLLQRELVFAPIAAAAVSSEAIGLAVAVPLAMAGHGAWALVASLVTTAAAAAIVYAVIGLYRYPRPLLRLSFDDLRSLYAYGSYQVGERIINYLSAHIDKVLIGKLVGPSALGFYDLAWQVVAFPLNRINPTVHNVLFPAYARLENPAQRERYYASGLLGLNLLLAPLFSYLVFFADDIIGLAFGDGWQQSADLLRLLALVGLAKSLANPGGALILARHRPDVGFYWNLFWSLVVGTALLLALTLSSSAMTAATVLLFLNLTVGLWWHRLVARVGAVSYARIIPGIGGVLAASGVLCLGLWFVLRGIGITLPEWRVPLSALAMVLAWAAYVMHSKRHWLPRRESGPA